MSVIYNVSWLIISAIFGHIIIYVVLSRVGKASRLFLYFLFMVDSMKQPASVGLAPIM